MRLPGNLLSNMSALAIAALLIMQAPPAQAPTPTSGLKIHDTKIGKGEGVVRGDEVSMEYVGKLANGKVIDQNKGSYFKFVLGLGIVIPGWDKGLLGMKLGGVRELEIPPELAYGDRAIGPIPANSKLLFTVTLKALAHPKQRIKLVINKAGTGKGATWDEPVGLRYAGKLSTGAAFDDNLKAPAPFDVTVGQTRLIPGFTLGLLGIKMGETRTITIPPDLGYGARARSTIPANSTLVFKITRVEPMAAPSN